MRPFSLVVHAQVDVYNASRLAFFHASLRREMQGPGVVLRIALSAQVADSQVEVPEVADPMVPVQTLGLSLRS